MQNWRALIKTVFVVADAYVLIPGYDGDASSNIYPEKFTQYLTFVLCGQIKIDSKDGL